MLMTLRGVWKNMDGAELAYGPNTIIVQLSFIALSLA